MAHNDAYRILSLFFKIRQRRQEHAPDNAGVEYTEYGDDYDYDPNLKLNTNNSNGNAPNAGQSGRTVGPSDGIVDPMTEDELKYLIDNYR